MKWNRLAGNFIVAVDYDSVLDIQAGLTHNMWTDFVQTYKIVNNKYPRTFIVKVEQEVEIGEMMNLEMNNSLRLRVKVLEKMNGEDNTLLVTSDF